MTSPERELREIAELARKRAFDAERHGKAITTTNFHEIARRLETLLAAPAPVDCESAAGKTAEAVTQGCRAPDLPQAPAPTPAPPTQYSPKGNFCSICQLHDQWCEHIKSPAEPAVPERSVAMQVAEELMAQNMLDVPCVTALPVIERALAAVPEREPPRSMWPDDLTICRKCKRDMLTNRHAVDIWGQIACLPNVSWREQCDALAERPLRAEEEKRG